MSRAERNLLLLTTAANIGGMERMVCGLAREFDQRGWAVRTIFPQEAGSPALLKWCADQGVPAEAHPAVLGADAPHTRQDMARLRALVRQAHPDLVNVHYGDNFISLKDILAIRMAGPHRCVATVYHPTPWGRGNAKKKLMTRFAATLCHSVTTISQASQKILIEAGIPQRKIELIPCGLREPEQRPSREAARAAFGYAPNDFVVGTLARLVPHKGIGDLIRAVGQLPERSRVVAAVAGDGPQKLELESLAGKVSDARVRFLGRVPDVDQFYAACDLFALPSYLEGFGLVYVEAAFHGVPSIGTDVGGVPDAIESERTGLLIQPGDVQALAAAIQRLYREPELRARLGDEARARACSVFTEAAMGRRYEQLFARLCS